MDYTDQAKPIREGEELDQKRLRAFLLDTIPGLEGEMVVRQFPQGHSNLTYLVTFGDHEMVLRRPPFGTTVKTAHDMGREYRILTALQGLYPYAPRPLGYSDDSDILGSPFYIMERIRGIVLRKDLPAGLALSPEQVNALFRRLIEVHHELHAVDYEKAGLENFGKPKGYVARQILGWNRRYRMARTPDAPEGEAVMAWLADKIPLDTDRPTLIHNDFKFDNVVLAAHDPMQIVGVLDWEMATIGDPLMDVGSALAYWVEPDDPEEMQFMRMMPTHLKGAFTRRQMVDLYAQLSGRTMDRYDFYYCFGLFRLAVIAQQIYYRFYHGQTKDKRFQMMIFGVQILEKAARRVIDASKL